MVRFRDLKLDLHTSSDTYAPILPIWPGLLANTAFYAVILCALCFTPGANNRGLRRRRGACVRAVRV
jgi:hypothetical protein